MRKITHFSKQLIALVALVTMGANLFAQLPYNTTLTQSHYNNSKVVIQKVAEGNRYDWKDGGIRLGYFELLWVPQPGNWDDKYVVIALNQTSIPYQLTFKYKCNSGIATNPDWYVEESADNSNWSRIWSTVTPTSSAVSVSTDTYNAGPIDLSKSTKYIKLCYSGNYSGTFIDIKVTDQAYVNDPTVDDTKITSLDFGTAAISSGKVEKTFDVEWCNVDELSVTCDNTNFFTVTPASFGGKVKYGTQTITVAYDRNKEVGTHNGTITLTNGSVTKTVAVSGTTTKRSQAIHWNADLTATNFTLNAGDNLTGTQIATADNEDAEVTYTTSDANVVAVSPDGKTLYAIDNGTAVITVTATGNDIYDEVVDSKEFTVTSKSKQTITWEQNLMGLKTTQAGSTIALEASATSEGVITYAIEGGSAECITLSGENNATLTITGAVGEAYIIATQEGGLIGEEEWISATYRKHVKVRDPNAACDEYALADKSFSFAQGHKSTFAVQEYKLEGKPTTLTFSAKAGGKQYLWSEREPIYIDQYANFGSGLEWKQVTSVTLDENNKNYGPYKLEESATKIRFRTGDYSKQDVSNITIPRKVEFAVSESAITENAERNVRWSKTISVTRSGIDVVDITVVSDNTENPFEVSKTSIGTDCSDFGTETFEVSVTPREKGVTYTGQITISDGKTNPHTHVIDLSVTAVAFNQSIFGFELPETAVATDVIPAFEATASSGLEVTYSTSDETVATIVNGNQLKILKAGTVEVTAYQAGNDRYNEVSETKTIVITLAPVEITELPVAADLLFGQTLEESVLTGGKASQPGKFAWANPETQPAAGTNAYPVVFTPYNDAVYAAANAEVNIYVGKASQTIVWNEQLFPVTRLETAEYSAYSTSGLEITYTTSDSAIAYMEGNVLYALSAGTVTITATQAGDDSYLAAEPVAREVEIIDIVRITPLVTAPTATAITFGETVAASQIVGGKATLDDEQETEVAGSFQWADSTRLLNAGVQDVQIVFVPEDLTYYNTVHFEIELQVNQAAQEIVWVTEVDTLLVGEYKEIELSATSGLYVTLESSDSEIVEVLDHTLHGLTEGEVTIVAKQEGDNNYIAAEQVSKAVVVRPEIPEDATALDDTQGTAVQSVKVFRNGAIYVLRGNQLYTVQGQRAN